MAVLLPKSEFNGFQWTNKFRKAIGVKRPMASNEELKKAFVLLALQHQRAIVFRFRIAQPAVSLKKLMAGVLKRGVEELVKKAMEELRQKVLAIRREQGVSVKPSVLAKTGFNPSQPMSVSVIPVLLEKSGESEITLSVEEIKDDPEFLPAPEPELKPEAGLILLSEPAQKPEINFKALSLAMWNSKARDKAWQELRQDSFLLESREILAEVLLRLNKEQAQILSLRYEKGLSWKQIGQAMEMGRWQNTYGYFFRAIERIATLLRRAKVDFSSRANRMRVARLNLNWLRRQRKEKKRWRLPCLKLPWLSRKLR